jgi:hypothetical protein
MIFSAAVPKAMCHLRMCLVTERTRTEPFHPCFPFVWLGEAWNRMAPTENILCIFGTVRFDKNGRTPRLRASTFCGSLVKVWAPPLSLSLSPLRRHPSLSLPSSNRSLLTARQEPCHPPPRGISLQQSGGRRHLLHVRQRAGRGGHPTPPPVCGRSTPPAIDM